MKTLIIVRHAKADRSNYMLDDFQRPLHIRGIKDVTDMANLIATKIKKIDKIISSSANRALTTAEYFAKNMNCKMETDLGFYEWGIKYILKVIMAQNDTDNTIMIVGHNPVISSLVTYFIGNLLDEITTCGVVCIDFDTETWVNIDSLDGKLRFYEKPIKATTL